MLRSLPEPEALESAVAAAARACAHDLIARLSDIVSSAFLEALKAGGAAEAIAASKPVRPPRQPRASDARPLGQPPRWTQERRDRLRHLLDQNVARAAILQALNGLPGPRIIRTQLDAFITHSRKANRATTTAPPPVDIILPPVPGEGEAESKPDGNDYDDAGAPSDGAPKGGCLNVARLLEADALARATEESMSWLEIKEYAGHNKIDVSGASLQVLGRVNAFRRGHGLPPFKLVKPRGAFEALPPLVVTGKNGGDGRVLLAPPDAT